MDPAAERLAPLLQQLVNYERLRPDTRLWDLDVMRRLLARPGASPPPRPAVQVVGSKGKGTTTAMLGALAGQSGARVGCYTSPHVVTLLERLRIDRLPIDVAVLEPILRGVIAAPGPRAPTFFEALTAAAVEWFAQERVDLAVYEAGLGARLDATTAIDVDAAIVTTIELEHTDILGDTVAAIAAEKAVAVRPAGLGVTAARGHALEVLRRHSAAVGARLLAFGEDFGVHSLRRERAGLAGVLARTGRADRSFFLPEGASFEVQALALAAVLLDELLPELPLVLDPAPRPRLPCRFEVRTDGDGATIVLDGAHTEESLAVVAEELGSRFPGQRVAVLFASAAGKRWREGLSALLPAADSFVVTELTGTPGEPARTIADWLVERGARTEVTADVTAGLAALRARPGPRLVVGSFYLAGQVRRLLDAAPPP
jgi:dihydrofolate synthase / folylpolyglutamate synthase